MTGEAVETVVPEAEQAQTEQTTVEQTAEEQPPVEEVVAPTKAEPVEYLIKRGDNLLRILRTHYGDESKLQEICLVNNIKNPDNIQVGQTILLP